MQREEAYLFEILGNYINGTESKARETVDWNRLIELAQAHQVGGILYEQCRSFLPEQTAQSLMKQHAQGVGHFIRRKDLIGRLESVFSAENIEFLTVKGMDVAACYPNPYLRTMGDVDILLHSNDRERAHQILLDLGFGILKIEDREWVYGIGDLHVELHDHLFYEQVVNDPALMAFSDQVWAYTSAGEPGSTRRVLDWNYHFVFLVAHLKEHFLADGVGIRQFMDLVMVSNTQKLDFGWIYVELEKLGLLEFGRKCRGLCTSWFGVPVPVGEPLSAQICEEVADYVMSNGVFGFQNEENTVRNRISQNGRWKALLLTVFPPYGELCQYDQYSFVRGKPWLLPATWVYRIFYGLRHGKASLAKQMAGAMVSDQVLEKRKQLLEKVGL